MRRRFDLIMVWSVDRLGRSLQDLVGFLSDIHGAKVDLFLQQQGVDTTTPGGKALFQMMGVFAEFERAMIQERVRAGLARVRASGKTKSGKQAKTGLADYKRWRTWQMSDHLPLWAEIRMFSWESITPFGRPVVPDV